MVNGVSLDQEKKQDESLTEIKSKSTGKYSASPEQVVTRSPFNRKKFDHGCETIRRHSHSGVMPVYRIINKKREKLSVNYTEGEKKYGHCDFFTW